ncbi:SAM-dependent methyltransferase [Plantactinospora solaniradicis]|uniref:SAM-dependent methyltransferase n=1 Tax=Plantactinospora solaniradicis TaxID=1723736 RepID=A0ABW1KN43_9ACTN
MEFNIEGESFRMHDEDEPWMAGLDRGRANSGRVYDYLLGGSHNFAADRKVAQEVMRANPLFPRQAGVNRSFLGRAVTYLADQGMDQFLDIGSGIPTQGNVHEIAQRIVPESRIVYVDIDPVAVFTANQLLAGNDNATALEGDLTHPGDILEQLKHDDLHRLIDFDKPVAVLLVAVLHFVSDHDAAHAAVAHLRNALAPGSHLVISHVAPESFTPEQLEAGRAAYRQGAALPFTLRTREQVADFFGDFALVEPGLTWLPSWRPAGDEDFADDPIRSGVRGGIGRKS